MRTVKEEQRIIDREMRTSRALLLCEQAPGLIERLDDIEWLIRDSRTYRVFLREDADAIRKRYR